MNTLHRKISHPPVESNKYDNLWDYLFISSIATLQQAEYSFSSNTSKLISWNL